MITASLRRTSMTLTSVSMLSLAKVARACPCKRRECAACPEAHARHAGQAATTQTGTSPPRLTTPARPQRPLGGHAELEDVTRYSVDMTVGLRTQPHFYTRKLVSAEVDEQPAEFVPVTLNLYVLPLTRPSTVISPDFADVVTVPVCPPSVAVAVSEVIDTSLFVLNDTAALVFPRRVADTVTLKGLQPNRA